jgi:hypothetical protein
MGRGLYALVSLAFFIQVQTVDVSRQNLQKTTYEQLVDQMTQEGELVNSDKSRKAYSQTVKSKACWRRLPSTTPNSYAR